MQIDQYFASLVLTGQYFVPQNTDGPVLNDPADFPKSPDPEEDETVGFPNRPVLVVAGLPKSPADEPVDWLPNGLAVVVAPSPPPPNGLEVTAWPSPEI